MVIHQSTRLIETLDHNSHARQDAGDHYGYVATTLLLKTGEIK